MRGRAKTTLAAFACAAVAVAARRRRVRRRRRRRWRHDPAGQRRPAAQPARRLADRPRDRTLRLRRRPARRCERRRPSSPPRSTRGQAGCARGDRPDRRAEPGPRPVLEQLRGHWRDRQHEHRHEHGRGADHRPHDDLPRRRPPRKRSRPSPRASRAPTRAARPRPRPRAAASPRAAANRRAAARTKAAARPRAAGSPAAEAMRSTISDRYELGDRLGSGGMSTVYRATDRVLERTVAVKILAEHLSDDEQVRRPLPPRGAGGREADPPQHRPGLRHRRRRGPPLHRHGVRRGPLGGPAPADARGRSAPTSAAEIGVQACAGLDYAHRQGIIHRDVKPGNLMVIGGPAAAPARRQHAHEPPTGEMTVKLTDFGIARAAEQTRITQVGSVVGTAAYLAPEQVRGEEATPAADVYALGVVLYQFLTGRLPYEGSTLAELAIRRRTSGRCPPPPTTPSARDAVARRCCARSRATSAPATRRRASSRGRSAPACRARAGDAGRRAADEHDRHRRHHGRHQADGPRSGDPRLAVRAGAAAPARSRAGPRAAPRRRGAPACSASQVGRRADHAGARSWS